MKLSKLYCNMPDTFAPVNFVDGLNVVLAEIRLPQNQKKDTHNLGKTIFGSLIDFCLLAGRDKNYFLFKHFNLFEKFVFLIEIELLDETFVTIRRSVEDASTISFKRHEESRQNFTKLADAEWDHFNVPFERARSLLDGLLDLRALKPWSYRKGLGYLLRSQDDFRDVFQLRKFQAAHSDWKPYLAHILGFRDEIIQEHYRKEDDLAKMQQTAQTLEAELRGSIADLSKIEGMLLLKQKEVGKKQELLDAFDFRAQDKRKTKQLVEEIDARISHLNSERYYLNQNKKKIDAALEEEQILFDPDEAERLFKESGVFFEGQIKRDFQQLIAFNRAITVERRAYLGDERNEIDAEIKKINSELNDLGKRHSEILSFVSSADSFKKYKQFSNEIVNLKADIAFLERQRVYLQRLQELRKRIRAAEDEIIRLQALIEEDVEKQNSTPDSLFSSIRLFFSEIIEEVIDRKALLTVSPNKEGHLDFKVDILDESGNASSAGHGHTYQKLLCIAFDMAITRAHSKDRFPHFLFHDGVFESLDNRKKVTLLDVIRRYSEYGIQHIITLIDSDLPKPATSIFDDTEIILRLHDENDQGRLFKMRSW
jgi:uncharacterized protein YydD (DUF2326 family)